MKYVIAVLSTTAALLRVKKSQWNWNALALNGDFASVKKDANQQKALYPLFPMLSSMYNLPVNRLEGSKSGPSSEQIQS